MHRRGCLLAATIALALGAGRADYLYDDLQGTWAPVEAEREGIPAPELLSRRLVLNMERRMFEIREGGSTLGRGRFVFAEGKDLHPVEFRHDQGRWKGRTWLGVLRWDFGEDRLTICDNAPDPARPRPTGLATGPGSGLVRLTFRRE